MMINRKLIFIAGAVFSLLLSDSLFAAEADTGSGSTQPVSAKQEDTKTTANPPASYTDKGADTCIKCHDEDSEFPVLSIFKTKHARQADARTPFAHLQCETCHGPGAEHAKNVPPDQKQAPITMFGVKSKLSEDGFNPVPSEQQNQVCMKCHQGNAHINWKDSIHDKVGTACASCHTIHAERDPVLSKQTQPDVCFRCHVKERADFFKVSTHPVRAGLITCSECHNQHGTGADKLLAKPTVNQTCYTCHAEKRGPFLWKHAPVSEDCTLCHKPHGSVHPALLVKSPPLLCQQCHAVAGHPSVARTGAALPGGSAGPSGFLLVGACTNCHSQVHGSNHPSGVKGMR